MSLPYRKPTRIPGYDYSTRNYYFVTICTHEKKRIFGMPGSLNENGKIAEMMLHQIPSHFPEVCVDKAVVMPNHVHAILVLGCETMQSRLPNQSVVVGQYKASVARELHKIKPDMQVWQRSFHDHVIRNQSGYEKIWQYIDTNPLRWEEDCFFTDF